MVVHNDPTAGEVGTDRSVGPVPPSLARSESSNQRETLSQETEKTKPQERQPRLSFSLHWHMMYTGTHGRVYTYTNTTLSDTS